MSLHRIVTLTARALRLRCPHCGGGPLFSSWFRVRDRCPACHLRLERGEHGYVVGAYMFNIIAAELLFGAIAAAVVVATWPSPPWTALQWGGAALMIAAPLACYPFSKTLFLAFDLMFRPAQPEEFELLK
ncbi:MAG: DUF983 domain-containing protein [Gemmatimonadales bacterium]